MLLGLHRPWTELAPRGRLGILTDRNQLSWIFLNDPKNTFQKLTPKKCPPIRYDIFEKGKYNMLIMKDCVTEVSKKEMDPKKYS